MAFQEVSVATSGEKFKFDKIGTTLTGYYLGDETITINGAQVVKHNFRTESGEVLSPLTSRNLAVGLESIAPGTMVRITYTEKKNLKGGKTVKIFKFEVDNDDVLPGIARPQSTAEKIESLKSQKSA